MKWYSVSHITATPYHPHTSGQVEVSNRELKRILKKSVANHKKDWVDHLDDAFWPYRIAYKIPTEVTPYRLVYQKVCHLPIELELPIKQLNCDPYLTDQKRKLQLKS